MSTCQHLGYLRLEIGKKSVDMNKILHVNTFFKNIHFKA